MKPVKNTRSATFIKKYTTQVSNSKHGSFKHEPVELYAAHHITASRNPFHAKTVRKQIFTWKDSRSAIIFWIFSVPSKSPLEWIINPNCETWNTLSHVFLFFLLLFLCGYRGCDGAASDVPYITHSSEIKSCAVRNFQRFAFHTFYYKCPFNLWGMNRKRAEK